MHLRRDLVHVDAFASQELPGILDAINAGRFDVDFIEAGAGQLGYILVFLQCSRDATDLHSHAAAHLFRHVAADYHVGDDEAAAGL